MVAGEACLTHGSVMSTLTHPRGVNISFRGSGCTEAHTLSTRSASPRTSLHVRKEQSDNMKQVSGSAILPGLVRPPGVLMHAIALGSCSGRVQAET